MVFTVNPPGNAGGFPQVGMSKPTTQQEEPLRSELRSFLNAVRSSTSPKVTLEEGRSALAVALQILDEIRQHAGRAGLDDLVRGTSVLSR